MKLVRLYPVKVQLGIIMGGVLRGRNWSGSEKEIGNLMIPQGTLKVILFGIRVYALLGLVIDMNPLPYL
jgi:hypothetical protein